MRKNSLGMAVALVLTSSVVLFAAKEKKAAAMSPEQKAAMEQAMKLGAPSENHKALEPLIGSWSANVKFWMKPGDKPQTSMGTSQNTWIMDGRFLKQEFKGDMNGQPFEGLGITGYDNIKGEYQSIWLDNMMTGLMYGTGASTPATKTISIAGTFSCPMTGEKNRSYRSEWKIVNSDANTYTSYDKGPDGKEYISMVIEFKRAK